MSKFEIVFSPIAREVRETDKNGEKNTKTIPYKLQFIDSPRFMRSAAIVSALN